MAATRVARPLMIRAQNFLTSPIATACLPALMVVAYWTGGEIALVVVALMLPGLLSLVRYSAQTLGTTHVSDGVTGLPPRSSLITKLDKGFISSSSPERACIVVEVDEFQSLIDRAGKTASELALLATSERIRSCLRQSDLVCYLGDARFGISVDKTPHVNLETLLQLVSRLQAAVCEPLSIDASRILPSASAGFALPSRAPESTGISLLSAAEAALNAAKHVSPGSIRAYTSDMKLPAAPCKQTTQELLAAMEDGQITPWFQPQISTDTGQVSGFEALVRWRHPEQGLIAPAAFLPAIMRANLHERLTEIMLYGSLHALLEWDKQGLHVPSVDVNFSHEDLCNPKLPEKIKWELDRFNLSPERLTVEILENVVAHAHDDIATHNIAKLAEIGCNIDLDDFGTGHASIANIRRFNVHRIKIDRSFVTHINTDRDQQNMCAAILTMAEQLDVGTVAEGVETEGEHAMLAQLGCTHVQGYSIAKPMPFEATPGWMKDHAANVKELSPLPRRA